MSPYGLVQERLRRGPLYPWRMLVACQLLNRTTGRQGVPAALAVLARWPTPESLSVAHRGSLRAAIRSCGLWRRRTELLRRLSAAWAAGERNPAALPGVGRYALDSYSIFVDGMLPRKVDDGKLELYLKWARSRRRVRR